MSPTACSSPASAPTRSPRSPRTAAYVGHDEPSVEFRSTKPGTGYDLTYQVQLPEEPAGAAEAERHPAAPGTSSCARRSGSGLTMCDTESAPEYTSVCTPDSDVNAKFTSSNPNSPAYIGRHPGNAFMELQFYEPGYVPQFEGFGCTATQWCANMTIDSLGLDQNTGIANNNDCLNNNFLVGEEPVNWAYVTKSGKSQAPADPLKISQSANPALALNPDPTKDLMMNSGDRLTVHMHDTKAGMRADITDNTTHQSGSMTASIANGFGQVVYAPEREEVHLAAVRVPPGVQHLGAPREHVERAHLQRGVLRRDRPLRAVRRDRPGHARPAPSPARTTPRWTRTTSTACPAPTPSSSTSPPASAAGGGDSDFDGESYQNRWPGTLANAANGRPAASEPGPLHQSDQSRPTDRGRPVRGRPAGDRERGDAGLRHRRPARTAPTHRLARRSTPSTPRRTTGRARARGRKGAPSSRGRSTTFGGSSKTAYGSLLASVFPEAGFTTSTSFENFNRDLKGNPCQP